MNSLMQLGQDDHGILSIQLKRIVKSMHKQMLPSIGIPYMVGIFYEHSHIQITSESSVELLRLRSI
jgi:hypothetical protein